MGERWASVPPEEAARRAGAREVRLIDVRGAAAFLRRHAAGSLHLPLVPLRFRSLAAALPSGPPGIVIADAPAPAAAAADGLAAAGHAVGGVLAGGLAAWSAAGLPEEVVAEIEPAEALRQLRAGTARLIDVREPFEWAAGTAAGALLVPLGDLAERAAQLPAGEYLTVCGHGSRSLQAAWLLQQRGLAGVRSVAGGMAAWQEQGLPLG